VMSRLQKLEWGIQTHFLMSMSMLIRWMSMSMTTLASGAGYDVVRKQRLCSN
jgi:hypothetical protein